MFFGGQKFYPTSHKVCIDIPPLHGTSSIIRGVQDMYALTDVA